MGWHADIDVWSSGSHHSWSIDQARGGVDDDISILDGLTFGWSLSGPVWPVQPDAMSASVAINVPNFADVADVNDGDPIAIEVTLVEGGDVWASFYGRVTDAQAVPRSGKRGGVTLQLTAVDYTVDIAEGVPLDWFGDGGTGPDWALVQAAFNDVCGGILPVASGLPLVDPPDIWTGPTPRLLDPQGLTTPKVAIDIALLSAVVLNGGGTGPGHRMILAPMIGSDGRLVGVESGTPQRDFTLDTVDVTAPGTVEVDAALVALNNLAWGRAKGDSPTQIVVTHPGAANATATAAGAPQPYIVHQIDTWLIAFDLAQPAVVATFYLPSVDSPWQVRSFTWHLHRLADADLAALPALFPDWKAAEGAAGRWSCYADQVHVAGINTTFSPDGTDEFTGQLLGAVLTITGGRLTLTPTVRLTS